jgi:hypothetical protein
LLAVVRQAKQRPHLLLALTIFAINVQALPRLASSM